MKVQFLVTVNIGRRDAQPKKEFEKEDGKAFIPYLKGKINGALAESWQYNAVVNSTTIKQVS